MTNAERRDMAHGYHPWEIVESEPFDRGRWTEDVRTVVRHEKTGQMMAIEWRRALTEMQENEYDEDPYEVEPYEHTIPARTVVRYRKREQGA